MSQLFIVLLERFGLVLSLEDAAPLLSYPSTAAARQALYRGTFPVPVKRAGRKLIISTLDIASFLDGSGHKNPVEQTTSSRGRPRASVASRRRPSGDKK